MSHCHDEHAGHGGHGHDHHHDDHHHDHDHDHSDDITPALQSSLYQQINFDDITTLNESRRDAGKAVVKKTWAERLSAEPELESDADEQLLMTVPYVEKPSLLLLPHDDENHEGHTFQVAVLTKPTVSQPKSSFTPSSSALLPPHPPPRHSICTLTATTWTFLQPRTWNRCRRLSCRRRLTCRR